MPAAACAVGRIGPAGPWVGFEPVTDHGYDLLVGTDDRPLRSKADPDDLVALAIAYFEEALDPAPDELAATHADIGSMVSHLAAAEGRAGPRLRMAEAADAIDDGLAADVVVGRLTACVEGGEEPLARLTRRAREMLGA